MPLKINLSARFVAHLVRIIIQDSIGDELFIKAVDYSEEQSWIQVLQFRMEEEVFHSTDGFVELQGLQTEVDVVAPYFVCLSVYF